MLKRRDQRGDTIVEVMLAIVVVSMVLVAAYQTTARSIDGVQTTQEHSEALQLAQTQLELLHNSSTMPATNQCFKTDGTLTSGNGCLVDASGNPTPVQPQFTLAFNAASAPTYEIEVSWASLTTNTKTNHVNLFYQP